MKSVTSVEDLYRVVNEVFEGAAHYLDHHGTPSPIGVIIGRIDTEGERLHEPRAFLLKPPPNGATVMDDFKTLFATMLQQAAKQFDAVGVITASFGEAEWAVGTSTRSSQALVITVEHRHFGQSIWVAPINRTGTSYQVEPLMRIDQATQRIDGRQTQFAEGKFGGRFFGLLPERWMN